MKRYLPLFVLAAVLSVSIALDRTSEPDEWQMVLYNLTTMETMRSDMRFDERVECDFMLAKVLLDNAPAFLQNRVLGHCEPYEASPTNAPTTLIPLGSGTAKPKGAIDI